MSTGSRWGRSSFPPNTSGFSAAPTTPLVAFRVFREGALWLAVSASDSSEDPDALQGVAYLCVDRRFEPSDLFPMAPLGGRDLASTGSRPTAPIWWRIPRLFRGCHRPTAPGSRMPLKPSSRSCTSSTPMARVTVALRREALSSVSPIRCVAGWLAARVLTRRPRPTRS